MKEEIDDLEIKFGGIFPPWLAIFLAAIVWACLGIVSWDYITGGMNKQVFTVIALLLTFAGVCLIFVVKASFKFNRWWKESKQELAAIKEENDRDEQRRTAEER